MDRVALLGIPLEEAGVVATVPVWTIAAVL